MNNKFFIDIKVFSWTVLLLKLLYPIIQISIYIGLVTDQQAASWGTILLLKHTQWRFRNGKWKSFKFR